ncbi:SUMO-conjugating enzyme SCE1 [Spatholobus suberectus]|nr:SUMO-conjugating enzyme SCE1 [Spatholobus suberectus]
MSGIARGRLAEERKSWRKNHPHWQISITGPHFMVVGWQRMAASFCVPPIAEMAAMKKNEKDIHQKM